MAIIQKRSRVSIASTVLLAWLFFGGVALTEQLELIIETGEQDSQLCEQALVALGCALKPDPITPYVHHADSFVSHVVDTSSSFYRPRVEHNSVKIAPQQDPPSLNLQQRLSTYRI